MKRLFNYDAYLFDLDGTIYSGEYLLPGVLRILKELKSLEKKILFVTNTTLNRKEAVAKRLEALGTSCKAEQVITALCVSGMYFQEFVPQAKILTIGEPVMREELLRYNLEVTENYLDATHVLVGTDRKFTYEKLSLAMKAVANGAEIIAANPDPYCPTDSGSVPDTWSLVKALETASQQEVKLVVGKPSSFYAQVALAQVDAPASRCLVIGDRLETDIQLGLNSGMDTLLVLTGSSSQSDIQKKMIYPHYVLTTLEEFWEEESSSYG